MGEEVRQIELEQVFRWKCLDCEHSNYHAGIVMSSDEVALPDLPEELIKGGEWVTIPAVVFCEKCESKFRVKEPEMPDFPDFPFPGSDFPN